MLLPYKIDYTEQAQPSGVFHENRYSGVAAVFDSMLASSATNFSYHKAPRPKNTCDLLNAITVSLNQEHRGEHKT